MRKIWFNGRILNETEAKLSVYDSALMFGDMAFEMTRSFNQTHFKLHEHLERLFSSMKYMHIKCNYTIEEIKLACDLLTVSNSFELIEKDDEHRLMINASRGALSIYKDVAGLEAGPNLMITDFPLSWVVSGFGKLYDEGINAVIVSQRALPARLLEPKIKHRSRLYLQMANIEAANHRGHNNWALLQDEDGFIAEGSGDNFFIVKDNVIYTPEGRNILRGISRDYIFELCKKHRIPCFERNIDRYDVLNADEAFMTGTPFCILPVCRLNNVQIGTGEVGMLTKALLNWWSTTVNVDIVHQIKSWDHANSAKEKGTTPYSFEDDNG